MDDTSATTATLDQADDEILTYAVSDEVLEADTVSDEALEAAAGTERGVRCSLWPGQNSWTC
jgi:hypothetical protein